jgi:Tol biopolymer transport system component/DNA-binding winged helix-turn-helix (wHTH) protein
MALPARVFDTLLALVEKEGRVVSKSELMDAVWADAFVEESNLSQNIYTLRRMLGVDEQGRQFIETVPRRGYRFAVPIRSLETKDRPGARTSQESVGSNQEVPGSSAGQVSSEEPRAAAIPEASALSPGGEAGSRRYLLYAVLGVLGILALIGAGFGIYRIFVSPMGTDQAKIAPIEQLRFQTLTDSGDVASPTISPDGELLAYVRYDQQRESVWIKQIATGYSFQSLAPSRKGYRSLVFSPKGDYLYFRDSSNPGVIYQTAPYGGAPRKLVENVWSDFSVSPDGKQFAFIRHETESDARFLVLSNVDGTGEREIRTGEKKLSYLSNPPAWSPDAQRIVVGTSSARLLMIGVASGEQIELKTPRWRGIFNILWMPDGRRLVFSARALDEPSPQIWTIAYPDGELRRLTNDIESYLWLSLSADGRMLVTRQRSNILHLFVVRDGDLKNARQLTFGERGLDGFGGVAWTPDERIVFSHVGASVTDLYLMNRDGGNRVRLTENSGSENNHPTVSRDGRHIVFTSNRAGSRQIWRMDIDGRNQKQLTFAKEQKESAQFPALTPDGEVFFVKHGSGPASICKVPIAGGVPVLVLAPANATPDGPLSISPDGKWLTYRHISGQAESTSEEPTLRIGVLPVRGGEPRFFDLAVRRSIIQWSTDSNSFSYAAGNFDSSSLWRQPLDGSEPKKLLDFSDRLFNFAWSRDGRSLIVAKGKEQGDAILITNLP